MNVLVTGGAGYVGSHATRLLEQRGHSTWVYDNLSEGHRAAVRSERLVVGDLMDRGRLETLLREKRIEAVMHFAASAYVGESVENPAKYYQNNIVATLSLMEAMRAAGTRCIVFSSSCATYGTPLKIPMTEDEPQHPINPYGFTKLAIEHALTDYAHAYGWGFAALRYFNASGAATDGSIGEDHQPETHLIPLVLQTALGQRKEVLVYGDDYPTADGTCIRDYVHVDDLATAHEAALERTARGAQLKLNLGTGSGASVRQVIDACCRITGKPIPSRTVARRPGDPPELIADASRAQAELEWSPQFTSMEAIVQTAWRWHSTHPRGFDDRSKGGSEP
jgi:UDP-glucose-4-epimerase GalE